MGSLIQEVVPLAVDTLGKASKLVVTDPVMTRLESTFSSFAGGNETFLYLLQFLGTIRYTPNLTETILDTYDYVIVGGGSAGSVLGNRLSEDPNTKVLILEAGPRPSILTEIPAIARLFFHTEIDWKYKTVPLKRGGHSLDNRQVAVTLGKAIGGSSVWNAMLDVRGNKQDYDDWAYKYNCTGWDYNSTLKYFIKLENNQLSNIDPGYHGTEGPVNAERPTYHTKYRAAVHKAAREAGYPFVDSNGKNQYGFFDHYATIRDGRRCSAAKAYLVPADHRPNLHIVEKARVKRVIIRNKKAIGVEFKRGKTIETVNARREVIVSAGAVHTPQVLMLSGIGPEKHLNELRIKVIQDLPVGQNLQDHSSAILAYTITGETQYLLNVLNPVSVLEYIANGTGPLSSTEAVNTLAFLSRNRNVSADVLPDYQLYFSESYPIFVQSQVNIEAKAYAKFYGPHELDTKIWCFAQPLNPKSRGTITLDPTNPFGAPLIDPNYLDHEEDRKNIVAALMACNDIFSSPAFQSLNAKPIKTDAYGCGEFEATEVYFACLADAISLTMAHLSGTARMGNPPDPLAVVDTNLRVIGIDNLRVVDASIMPQLVSANTNVPTMAIAEKAADIIKGV